MGLSMRYEEEKACPVLTCDKCGKPIGDWSGAIVTHRWPSEDSPVTAKVYHKVECDPGSKNEDTKYSVDLRAYLPQLLWNHNWGMKGTNEKGATVTLNVP